MYRQFSRELSIQLRFPIAQVGPTKGERDRIWLTTPTHCSTCPPSEDGTHRPNRSILLPIRVTLAEREALRAAAAEANMSVAAFIRAAIAVYARDGYCQRVADSKPEAR